MTFSAPFSRVITRPFGGVPSGAWWLSGGIAAANCIAAYQPKGAASLAASYVNLAKPGTYDCTAPVDAPSLDATAGWVFTGSTGCYLDTNVVPTGDNWSIGVRFTDYAPGDGRAITGFIDTNTGLMIVMYPKRYSWVNDIYLFHTTELSPGGTGMTGGVLFIAGTHGYKDGTALDGTMNGVSPLSKSIVIGALKTWNGSVEAIKGYSPVKIQAYCQYNYELTAPQVAALTIAMNAL